MAQARIRHFPLFIANRKFAEMHGVAYNMDSGDEIQDGADGVLGLSDGIIHVKIDADYVQTVQGTKISLVETFLAKKDVSVRIVIGGKAHEFPGRITNLGYNSESKSGAAHGKSTFMGAGEVDVS